jgi:hypothetical protein
VLVDPLFSRALAASPDREKRGLEIVIAKSLLGMDPPEHTRLRKLVAGTFTARRMREFVPQVAAIVDELIDRLLGGPRPADLVTAFSLPLPVRVICQMLGVPPGDQDRFRAWSDALVGDWDRDPAEIEAALDAMRGYLAELIEAKRAAPADDLISALIAMRDREDRLSEEELVYMCLGILLGGHETTANQINLSLLALLAHPSQLARLRSDPALLPGAVEELMRFVPLSTGLPPARVTAEEVTLGGVTIPAGEMVFPLFAIARCLMAHRAFVRPRPGTRTCWDRWALQPGSRPGGAGRPAPPRPGHQFDTGPAQTLPAGRALSAGAVKQLRRAGGWQAGRGRIGRRRAGPGRGGCRRAGPGRCGRRRVLPRRRLGLGEAGRGRGGGS